MKKAFKAPIVEIKTLSVENGIMDDAILLSATPANANLTSWNDTATQADFKQWKGFGE